MPVFVVLCLEPLPAGQRDNTNAKALSREQAGRLQAELDLAAGPDEHEVQPTRPLLGTQHIPAAGHPGWGSLGCFGEDWDALTGQHEADRPVTFHGTAPRMGTLGGV